MEAPVIEEDMVTLIVVLEKFHQGLPTLFGCSWVKSSAIQCSTSLWYWEEAFEMALGSRCCGRGRHENAKVNVKRYLVSKEH